MSPREGRRPSALIVHAHPEPTSFGAAQTEAARAALTATGHTVKVIDLYDRKWDPVLDRDEFGPVDGPFKPQREQWNAARTDTLPADVRVDLDAVLAADLLVLSFPLWWFSLPAILKGWVDRVFVMGAVFGGDLGVFDEAGMTGRRAVVLTTTGGDPASFTPDGAYGDIGEFLFHVNRGMLAFVGYEVLEPVVTYRPARLPAADRDAALESVRRAFTGIDARPSDPRSVRSSVPLGR